jgi:uncharacterized repeat protein (TIGR02543 family)
MKKLFLSFSLILIFAFTAMAEDPIYQFNLAAGAEIYMGSLCSCSATFSNGTVVTLTATCRPGYTFTGWTGGGCESVGNNPVCAVTVNSNTSVTALCDLNS